MSDEGRPQLAAMPSSEPCSLDGIKSASDRQTVLLEVNPEVGL